MNEQPKPNKKPFFYYAMIAMLILMLLNAFVFPSLMTPRVTEVSYDKFLDMLSGGQVTVVELQENERELYFKAADENGAERIYSTGVFPDAIRTFKADTLEDLAEKLEINDVDAFVETVNRYNELCEKGQDEDFGKPPEYLAKVDTPPFYGIHRWVRMSAICSGVDVNADHQCLTPEGEVIEGLYAIGNCAGGFYGGIDYPLTVFGLSLGRCYTEGYVIGRMVAEK